jgi:hypothetical protein
VDNPKLQQWAAQESTFKWSDVTKQNEAILRINAKWREQDAAYDAIKDPDERTQAKARAAYLEANPEYARARYERDARQLELDDVQVSKYVEYSQLPDYGYYKLRYRKDNPDFDAAMKTALKDKPWADLDPAKIPAQQYDDLYEQYRDLFDQYDNVQGTEEQRAAQREDILDNNPAFKTAYYQRQAYGELFEEKYIQNYVDYYLLPVAGYARERYLKEHQDFYATIRASKGWTDTIDFDTIPTEAVEKLYAIYMQISTSGYQREAYRKEHPDLDAWLVKVKGLQPLGHVHQKTTASQTVENFEASYNQAQEQLRGK